MSISQEYRTASPQMCLIIPIIGRIRLKRYITHHQDALLLSGTGCPPPTREMFPSLTDTKDVTRRDTLHLIPFFDGQRMTYTTGTTRSALA